MTQMVHSSNRETRTKRIACVRRLMRTRAARTRGGGVLTGGTER